MSGEKIDGLSKAVGALSAINEMAKDVPEMKSAVRNVAVAANTVTSLVNNILLPIAAINFAFEKGKKYFETYFEDDLKEATKNIPEGQLCEPSAALVAPIIRDLTFAHEEPNLKEMYFSLLSTAMNRSKRDMVHPSFSKVIESFSPEEAGLFKHFRDGVAAREIVLLKIVVDEQGAYREVQRHVYPWINTQDRKPAVIGGFGVYVENWIRLGLIQVDYTRHTAGQNAYDWVKGRPEYVQFLNIATKDGHKLEIEKGIIELTAFGRSFCASIR